MNNNLADRTARDYLWYVYGYIQRNDKEMTTGDMQGLEVAIENAITLMNERECDNGKETL